MRLHVVQGCLRFLDKTHNCGSFAKQFQLNISMDTFGPYVCVPVKCPFHNKNRSCITFVNAPATIIPAWRSNQLGDIYSKIVVSKAGDFIVHMLHIRYFSKTNENLSSENDPLLFILSLVGHEAFPGILLYFTSKKSTVTSNHLPHPHRESPWGDEKLSDTLTARRLGENGKSWISKFSLNNITQILLHIKDYNICNSSSLTDMRLLPQK